VLLDTGTVTYAGRELAVGDLAVVEAGTRHTPLEVVAGESGARVVVLGGPPFEEEVVMWWNFVGRSHDEVVAAQEEWNAHGGRFGYVAGYVPRSDEHWWIRHRTCPVCGCGREGGWGGPLPERTPNGGRLGSPLRLGAVGRPF
jgi:hypothetical protein